MPEREREGARKRANLIGILFSLAVVYLSGPLVKCDLERDGRREGHAEAETTPSRAGLHISLE